MSKEEPSSVADVAILQRISSLKQQLVEADRELALVRDKPPTDKMQTFCAYCGNFLVLHYRGKTGTRIDPKGWGVFSYGADCESCGHFHSMYVNPKVKGVEY